MISRPLVSSLSHFSEAELASMFLCVAAGTSVSATFSLKGSASLSYPLENFLSVPITPWCVEREVEVTRIILLYEGLPWVALCVLHQALSLCHLYGWSTASSWCFSLSDFARRSTVNHLDLFSWRLKTNTSLREMWTKLIVSILMLLNKLWSVLRQRKLCRSALVDWRLSYSQSCQIEQEPVVRQMNGLLIGTYSRSELSLAM